MTSRITKRVRYFVGKLLKKKDFEKEQDYHLEDPKSKVGKTKATRVAKKKIERENLKEETEN